MLNLKSSSTNSNINDYQQTENKIKYICVITNLKT